MTAKTMKKEQEYNDLEWAGIDHSDYPDYCDAYIVRGILNGREMTEDEVHAFNMGNNRYELLMKHLY